MIPAHLRGLLHAAPAQLAPQQASCQPSADREYPSVVHTQRCRGVRVLGQSVGIPCLCAHGRCTVKSGRHLRRHWQQRLDTNVMTLIGVLNLWIIVSCRHMHVYRVWPSGHVHQAKACMCNRCGRWALANSDRWLVHAALLCCAVRLPLLCMGCRSCSGKVGLMVGAP